MTYRTALFLGALATLAGASCSDNATSADEHKVFFVGYVYDGATGARLDATKVQGISIKYRDKVVRTKLETDGRFVTLDPLPTRQDYAVYIGATGYRPFVSNNEGFDVPRSLSMTDGLAGAATEQTFHFDAYLFPTAVKSPKVVISVEQSDAATAMPTPPRASGTMRLRPLSSSLLERASLGEVPTGTIVRRWSNDEDLLAQTLTRPFTEGRVEFNEGELSYGVLYEIAVFDVKGYQPIVLGTQSQQPFVAGSVTSRSVTLQKEQKDPLRVLATNTDTCTPPAGNAMTYGAEIRITFNEEIEFVSPTAPEDIDNGVAVYPSNQTSSTYCPLKMSTETTRQERGTRATIEGRVLVLAFNPSIGFSPTSSFGSPCMIPSALTQVTYGNLANVQLRPKGDANRRRSLGTMLGELPGNNTGSPSSAISCGRTTNPF
jgi:hypothetical protein